MSSPLLTPRVCTPPLWGAMSALPTFSALLLTLSSLSVMSAQAQVNAYNTVEPTTPEELGSAEALDVPAPLKPWVGWVEASLPEVTPSCAQSARGERCVWPSALELELMEGGARFVMRVSLERAGRVALPYAGSSWPQGLERFERFEGHKGANQTEGTGTWRPQLTSSQGEQPYTTLPQGEVTLRGVLRWASTPDWVQVPLEVGLTSLKNAGGEGTAVERDGQGRLWLRTQGEEPQGKQDKEQGESLHAEIYRVFYDEVPLRVVTHVKLNTSGKAREVTLKGLELEGAQLTHLSSDLTTEASEEGVRVYLKPGRASLTLTSLLRTPLASLSPPTLTGAEPPPYEVWVWHNNERLRTVSLEGLNAVDAELTSLPSELKGGDHTLLAPPGAQLTLKELQRGVQELPPNRLTLSRELWLDLDGEGFVSRDTLQGSLNRGGRLNYGAKGQLGRATLEGAEGGPLLITQDPKSQQEGVELRSARVKVSADVRDEHAHSELKAVGWAHMVDQLSITLHLPPGWRLMNAEGTASDGAWLDTWELFSLFIVLLITVAVARTLGKPSAAIALLFLVLAHGEREHPSLSWLLLLLIGSLLPHLKAPWLRRLALTTGAVTLFNVLMMALPMVHQDARLTLHPHLDAQQRAWSAQRFESSIDYSLEEGYANMNMRNISAPQMKLSKGGRYKNIQLQQAQAPLRRQLNQVDPNAVVQTGPGVPTWRWRSHHLAFSGPISPDQTLKLSLLSPAYVRLWHASRALSLLALLGLVLMWLKGAFERAQDAQGGSKRDTAVKGTHAVGLMIGLLVSVSAVMGVHMSIAHAQEVPQQQQQQQQQQPFKLTPQALTPPPSTQQALPLKAQKPSVQASTEGVFPPQAMLDELRERLLKRRPQEERCQGECLYLPFFELSAEGRTLTLKAEVHAEGDTALLLPGKLQRVAWREVKLNGITAPTRGERHGEDLALAVRVPRGVHTLSASATLADLESLTLTLYDRPRQLSLDLKGWSLEGEQAQVEGSLTLTREQQASPQASPNDPQASEEATPPSERTQAGSLRDLTWFQVHRHLVVGLPWEVETTIMRPHSAQRGAQAFTLPLLKGERLLSPEVSLSAQGARVSFAEGEDRVSFVSELSPQEALTLTAPSVADSARWSETWELTCGAVWQCAWSGLLPESSSKGVSGARWSPWPGERLDLTFTRPLGVEGADSTVREATVEVTPGAQLLNGEVSLSITASRGGARHLQLPKSARQVRLFVKGVERPDPTEDQEGKEGKERKTVRLPLSPGSNKLRVTWTQPITSGRVIEVPRVTLDGDIVNLTLKVNKPRELWLLWTSGPAWGPAVLFWGYLLFSLLIALALGKSGLTPLSARAWFLLTLGFTQVHPIALVIVALWFIALQQRRHLTDKLSSAFLFNLLQLSLLGLTLAFVICLVMAVRMNLLGDVSVQVAGAGSTERVLRWYVDRAIGLTPEAKIYTLPLWAWKGLMLVWSMWLANALTSWAVWAWSQWSAGELWRPLWARDQQDSEAQDPKEQDPDAHNQVNEK